MQHAAHLRALLIYDGMHWDNRCLDGVTSPSSTFPSRLSRAMPDSWNPCSVPGVVNRNSSRPGTRMSILPWPDMEIAPLRTMAWAISTSSAYSAFRSVAMVDACSSLPYVGTVEHR